MIVALPGLFSYLFFFILRDRLPDVMTLLQGTNCFMKRLYFKMPTALCSDFLSRGRLPYRCIEFILIGQLLYIKPSFHETARLL